MLGSLLSISSPIFFPLAIATFCIAITAWALGIGLVVSFVVAWAVIAAFLTYVQRHTLRVFAYYRIMLGVIVLLVFH